jgi:hypothetical protein
MQHWLTAALVGHARNAVAAAWCIIEADQADLLEGSRADGQSA